jgi:hypothetical protein
VRGYIAVGVSGNDVDGGASGTTFSANRAFIQWAGFTFGHAQSFYDFYSVPATSYWGTFPASDTGDPGWKVLGYTAQFGNGFSATIAAEMRRNTRILDTEGGTNGGYGGFLAPDVVGNVRIDQAWGSAQIMGAWHQVNTGYYADSYKFAHPDNESGWAVGAGIKLNAPMIGPGDFFQAQVNYTRGALRYIFSAVNFDYFKVDGQEYGFGLVNDAVYGGSIAGGNATQLELTTAWNVNAAFEHHWNPRWKTSLYGGYAQVSYGSLANALLCFSQGDSLSGSGATAVANVGCDNDWQTWWVGTRTQWNVTKDFYMGLDVLYSKLHSASLSPAAAVIDDSVTGPVSDQDNWQFRFRVHRDFYP